MTGDAGPPMSPPRQHHAAGPARLDGRPALRHHGTAAAAAALVAWRRSRGRCRAREQQPAGRAADRPRSGHPRLGTPLRAAQSPGVIAAITAVEPGRLEPGDVSLALRRWEASARGGAVCFGWACFKPERRLSGLAGGRRKAGVDAPAQAHGASITSAWSSGARRCVRFRSLGGGSGRARGVLPSAGRPLPCRRSGCRAPRIRGGRRRTRGCGRPRRQ